MIADGQPVRRPYDLLKSPGRCFRVAGVRAAALRKRSRERLNGDLVGETDRNSAYATNSTCAKSRGASTACCAACDGSLVAWFRRLP